MFALYFTVFTVGFSMAALAEFVPDFRMDAQGMALASPENKAQWILEHHIEFQKRQAI